MSLADYFLENGIVSMGWGIGPVGPVESVKEIAIRLKDPFPGYCPSTLSKWAGEIRKFNQDMGVGDAAATYEPRRCIYHIGIIRSLLVDLISDTLRDYEHGYVHRVEWLRQVVKDALSRDYRKHNLDRRATLHRLSPEASVVLRQAIKPK